MQLVEIMPRIYHAACKDQGELAMTFLRFQEFYESPRFRGKVFTREEFLAWHATSGLDPYEEWDGFNVPGWVWRVFAHGSFDPLTPAEQSLVDQTRQIQEPFYVIGTAPDDTNTMNHELSHALYYLERDYREQVLNILTAAGGADGFPALRDFLKSQDYSDAVMLDEIHAYLLFEHTFLEDKGVDIQPYGRVTYLLAKNFNATCSALKNSA